MLGFIFPHIGTVMDLCFDGYSEASGGVWQLLGHMANARLAKHYHQQSEEEEADPGCDEGKRLNVVVQDVPGGGRCGECGEEETVGHGGGEGGRPQTWSGGGNSSRNSFAITSFLRKLAPTLSSPIWETHKSINIQTTSHIN